VCIVLADSITTKTGCIVPCLIYFHFLQARLFGWVTEDELQVPEEQRYGLQGAQAQYVRVPLADATLVKVRDSVC
jgi:hypothetical protein